MYLVLFLSEVDGVKDMQLLSVRRVESELSTVGSCHIDLTNPYQPRAATFSLDGWGRHLRMVLKFRPNVLYLTSDVAR